MKYKSVFVEIEVNSHKEAFEVLTHFCDYCIKGSIERFHCSGYHASICEETKKKIRKDWFKKA